MKPGGNLVILAQGISPRPAYSGEETYHSMLLSTRKVMVSLSTDLTFGKLIVGTKLNSSVIAGMFCVCSS